MPYGYPDIATETCWLDLVLKLGVSIAIDMNVYCYMPGQEVTHSQVF
ncbi:unnamed protein product [Musa hybrid cultivar]